MTVTESEALDSIACIRNTVAKSDAFCFDNNTIAASNLLESDDEDDYK